MKLYTIVQLVIAATNQGCLAVVDVAFGNDEREATELFKRKSRVVVYEIE